MFPRRAYTKHPSFGERRTRRKINKCTNGREQGITANTQPSYRKLIIASVVIGVLVNLQLETLLADVLDLSVLLQASIEERVGNNPDAASSTTNTGTTMMVGEGTTVTSTASSHPINSDATAVEKSEPARSLPKPAAVQNDISLHVDERECSCVNNFPNYNVSGSSCCRRHFVALHKMGWMATHDLRKRFFPKVNIIRTERFYEERPDQTFIATRFPSVDYRIVLITRNWYDTFVSGYLYHKAGRECWTNMNGERPRRFRRGEQVKHNWENEIQYASAVVPWPPGKGRNICEYLRDESETDGMRVYMEWSMFIWYRPLLEVAKIRREADESLGFNRTLFMCYEEIVSADSYVDAVRKIHDWFHPGQVRRSSLKVPPMKKKYEGKHATDHDPNLRKRLERIVQMHDEKIFKGEVALGNSFFGCG